jgi:hypothetical protein
MKEAESVQYHAPCQFSCATSRHAQTGHWGLLHSSKLLGVDRLGLIFVIRPWSDLQKRAMKSI